jgi:hypothetical protein
MLARDGCLTARMRGGFGHVGDQVRSEGIRRGIHFAQEAFLGSVF